MRGVAASPGAADVLARLQLSPRGMDVDVSGKESESDDAGIDTGPGWRRGQGADDGWERVLWKRHGLDDNYVPRDFLSGLEINRSGGNPPSYWLLVRDSGAIVQQLAIVALFSWCFAFLHLCPDPTVRLERVRLLRSLNVVVASLGALVSVTAEGGPSATFHFVQRLVQIGMMVVSLRLMSPLLLTLSGTVSTDSVYAISTLCFILHLYRFDYAYVLAVPDVGWEGSVVYPVEVEAEGASGSAGAGASSGGGKSRGLPSLGGMDAVAGARAADRPVQFSGHASVVLSTFSSVLLVSRLEGPDEVFALIVWGILSFALLPSLQHSLRRRSESLYGMLTVGLAGVATFLLSRDSPRVVVFAFCGACLTITFVAPLAMVRLHRGRRTINGPWDERVVKEKVI